ncbi:unnamed protein product [Paramecium sonneborni]|uniref:Uncharacterized protein n=1 Tax=Paramecium sonneborni TaxID=65129 RepID=A0A8S1R7Y2_9CILI|nr:unnamed protein product [Paramecium sonneborni]CAD8124347.1 unnamed protein product [Paramecium sonneborni]
MSQLSSNIFSLPIIGQRDVQTKQISVTRTIRPSLFLNQIDLIPQSVKTEVEINRSIIYKTMPTEIISNSLIDVSSHIKLPLLSTQKEQKLQKSRNTSPIEYQRNAKKAKLFLKRQESKTDTPIIKFQSKRVEFNKSLVVIDLETGIQDKQELNEMKKPLRRIAHQKTRPLQKIQQ